MILLKKEYNGAFLRFMLGLGFLSGAVIYFGMIFFSSVPASIGFGILGVFSLLAFLGVILIDMSAAEYFRLSTRFAAGALPFVINIGALLSGIMAMKGKDSLAVYFVTAAIFFSLVIGAVLGKRFFDDDL